MPLAVTAQQAAFAQGKDGAIWMAEVNRSVYTVPKVGDRSPNTELILGLLTLLIDRKEASGFGTVGDGLGRIIDPSRIRERRIDGFGVEAERFTQKDGLLSDIVHALLEDREGNIWVAGDRGLERFREGAFAPVATPGRSVPASSSQVGTRRSGPLRSAYTDFCGWPAGPGNDPDRFFRYQPSPGQFGSPLVRLWRQGLPFPRTALRPGALGPE
jgi:hypothetical protein